MNKFLASYIFTGEVLFTIKDKTKNTLLDEKPKAIEKPAVFVQKNIPAETEIENIFQTSHKLVVFVDQISENEKEMLAKILAAVKFDYNNTDLIITSIQDKKILISDKSNTLMFFGVNPKMVNIPFESKLYKAHSNGKQQLLICDKVTKVFENKNDEKKKLWAEMRVIFGV